MASSTSTNIADILKRTYPDEYWNEFRRLQEQERKRQYEYFYDSKDYYFKEDKEIDFSEEEEMKKLMETGEKACDELIEAAKKLKWLIVHFDGTETEREIVKEATLECNAAWNRISHMRIRS